MPRTFNGRSLALSQELREWFWNEAHPGRVDPPDRELALYWRCHRCDHWYTYDALQIGHRTEWEQYLKENGVTPDSSFEDAQAWFSDPRNLDTECVTCNTSHDWEYRNWYGESDDRDNADGDTEGNLAGFVTYLCPSCGSEETGPDDAAMDLGDGLFSYRCDACAHQWRQ